VADNLCSVLKQSSQKAEKKAKGAAKGAAKLGNQTGAKIELFFFSRGSKQWTEKQGVHIKN